MAAALQRCVEPTYGMWPLLEVGAMRIDSVDLAAEERGPRRVRVSGGVTVKIVDVTELREPALAVCPPPTRLPASRSRRASQRPGSGRWIPARRWPGSRA